MTWTTKDKREIPIQDLKDEHLFNIVKYLDRVGQTRFCTDCMTSYDEEPDIYIFNQARWDSCEAVRAEAARRAIGREAIAAMLGVTV